MGHAAVGMRMKKKATAKWGKVQHTQKGRFSHKPVE
jgi:hypothetical protein